MTEIRQRFGLPKRYKRNHPGVWEESQLTLDLNCSNLELGYPDYPPPQHVLDALTKVVSDPNRHQYTRDYGHPRLVQVLAQLYSKLLGLEINSQTEMLVTAGGNEALHNTISSHVDKGDEVIIIEPFFESYEPMVRDAEGIPRFIALKPTDTQGSTLSSQDFILDKAELERLFNPKTKAIIINNPNNSLGKVFTLEELMFIADLCKKHNVLCISDEAYEWITYKPKEHIRIAGLPGMWNRTITIGSAGKSLNVPGWKLGWAYGPANLINNLLVIRQNSVYSPIQEATAIALETELERIGSDECYFTSFSKELEQKRDFMATFLKEVGFKPIIPEGGYFMMADWTGLESQVDLKSETDKTKDYRFTKWMTKNIGLQGIPPSAFYDEDHKSFGENFVRYCFNKEEKILQAAADILHEWQPGNMRK